MLPFNTRESLHYCIFKAPRLPSHACKLSPSQFLQKQLARIKKLARFKREMVMLEETALYTVKHSRICVHILDTLICVDPKLYFCSMSRTYQTNKVISTTPAM